MIQVAPPKIPLPSLAPIRRRARLMAALALFWLVVVIANYYTKLWDLIFQPTPATPAKPAPEQTFPFLYEALSRAIKGIGGAGIALASAIILGYFISRMFRWRYRNWREALPYVAALGIGAFSYIGLGLAAVGLYRMEVLRALVALPLAGGLSWWFIRSRKLPHLQALRFKRPGFSVNWLWISIAVVAVAMAFFAALAPEIEYDALWYHLGFPQRYLDTGHLIQDNNDFVSLYPMTWELWFGFGLSLTGQTAAKLLHFATLPLTALVVYELTRRYFPKTSPWVAVVLFVTIPTVTWEASTDYIDLALALHLILALYGWLRYFERREKQWLFLASINLGLAVATKHTSLLFLFLICAGLALRLGQTERNLKQVIKPMLVAVGLGLAFALPWYLRSILATGNPFFPYLTSAFGAPPQWWDSVTENSLKGFMEKFGQPRTLPNLLVLPWDMTIHAARYDGTFGPLFLILLPLLVLQRWTRILKALFAFIFLVIAVWASPLLSFQMRFLIPLAPVLAVLGAYAFARLSTLMRTGFRRWGTIPLTLVFGALLVLNLPTFTVLHETDRVEWKGWLTSVLHDVPWKVVTGAESEGAYLQHNLKSFAVWNFANQNLPKDAKVLTWSSGDKLYAQRDYIWSNATSIRPIIWAGAGNDSRILPMMRQFGITHLIMDKRPPDSAYPWDNYAILGEVARANWYEKLYEDYNYVLYRVRWEQLDSQIAGASK